MCRLRTDRCAEPLTVGLSPAGRSHSQRQNQRIKAETNRNTTPLIETGIRPERQLRSLPQPVSPGGQQCVIPLRRCLAVTFLRHLASAAAIAPTVQFLNHLQANAGVVKKKGKSCILMWMGGGPPTIDIWDLKPGSKNGGEFKPISTAGDLQICEHLPKTALVMDELSVVRSMSTREADHTRGRYYMQTSFVPNPTVVHPSFGSVASFELGRSRKELEIPAFVSIGGGGLSPGYLGMRTCRIFRE